jgi:hypothetical protein
LNLVDFTHEYGKLYAIGKGQGEVMKTWAGMLLVGTLLLGRNGGCRASLTEQRVKDLKEMVQ